MSACGYEFYSQVDILLVRISSIYLLVVATCRRTYEDLATTAGTLFVFINDIFSLRSWRYCVVVEGDLVAKPS